MNVLLLMRGFIDDDDDDCRTTSVPSLLSYPACLHPAKAYYGTYLIKHYCAPLVVLVWKAYKSRGPLLFRPIHTDSVEPS